MNQIQFKLALGNPELPQSFGGVQRLYTRYLNSDTPSEQGKEKVRLSE